ncbi:MAG: helix-turn-helix domain-containing protein [Planctomycetes bacterium]|nr:helix-turn-helix domain-containing protein [Planctomycetota bacterium]
MKTDIIDNRRAYPLGQLLMTPKEAALALRISPRKLWEMTKQGHLPYVPLGRCVRYRICDVEAWLSENTRRKDSSKRNVDRSECEL